MAKGDSPIRKNLVYILAVAVFILSVVLIYLQFTTLRDLKAEEDLEEQALQEARLELARNIRHRENAAEYEIRLAYAESMIPAAAGEDQLLNYIHRTAGEYNLHTVEVRFDPRNEEEQYTSMPVSIILEGGFQESRQFLRHLFSGERAIRVDDIRINRLDEGPHITRITLTVSAFYRDTN